MYSCLSVTRSLSAWFPGCPIALCLFITTGFCFSACIHDSVQRETVVVSSPRFTPHASRLHPRAAQHGLLLPLRITPWYLPGESVLITPAQSKKLQMAMSDVTKTIANVLSVRRVEEPLLLNRNPERFCHSIWRNNSLPNYNRCGSMDQSYRGETCLDIIIPTSHLRGFEVWPEVGEKPSHVTPDGTGVPDTDFLLYVRVAQTKKCAVQPSVIAYASYCQLDSIGRPLAGVIVFCPEHLKEGEYQHNHVVQVSLHELLHALGFSRSLFEHWIDCSLYETGDICSSRSRVANTDENGQFRIYTPTVLQRMGEHLGGGPVGAPLENKDYPLSASSHWESRVFQGSILTAALGPPHLTHLDIITLAAFKDMGWYGVNTSINGQLVWGKGAGHSFGLPSKCNDISTGFFCTGSEVGCHHLHLDKGICSTDSFLEGCWIYKPLPHGGECWLQQKEGGPEEIYGHYSRCFFSNLTTDVALQTKVRGRCYLHRCLAPNIFQVKVQGSEWTNCPPAEWIKVAGFDGYMLCPSGRLCMGFTHLTLPTSTGKPFFVSTVAIKDDRLFTSEAPWRVRVQVTTANIMEWSTENLNLLQEEVLVVIAQRAGLHRCLLHATPQQDQALYFTFTARWSEDCPEYDTVKPPYLALMELVKPGTSPITYNSPQFSTVILRLMDNGHPTLKPNDVANEPLIWGCSSALLFVLLVLILAWCRHRTQSLRVRDMYHSQVMDVQGPAPYSTVREHVVISV
ncbi:ciliated left-right organizer metallopeptidase [Pelodytes ibericus]